MAMKIVLVFIPSKSPTPSSFFRFWRIGSSRLDSFYVKFWSLQKYLKNPIILHSQQVLNEFKPKLDFVINKFYTIEQERMKLRGQAVNNNKPSTDQKMDIVLSGEDKSEYYPGFLKSRELFDLQVFTLSSPQNTGRFYVFYFFYFYFY